MHRPIGVSILGWLAIVWGALTVVVGVLGVSAGLYATAVGGVALNSGLAAGAGSFNLGLLVVALSALSAAVGLGDLVFGVGMLRLAGWAWTFGHVLMIASIGLDVVELLAVHSGVLGSLLGILVAAGILYYLHRPEVLKAFGRGRPPAPSQPSGSVQQPLPLEPPGAPEPPAAKDA